MANLTTLKRVGERAKTRVGRGGKRGKTSGRGTKGQNARAGHKKRPEMRDMIKKLPKRRGYGKNRGRTVNGTRPDAVAISLEKLNGLFENGAEVTMHSFVGLGLSSGRGLQRAPIKIVSGGELSKKLVLRGVSASASARKAIEEAGGSISSEKPSSAGGN